MSSLARVNRILEIFWWCMTGATFLLVLVMCFMYGWDKWLFYFAIPVLTAILALVRRFMSKKLTKSEAERDQQQRK
jgi:membrane protein implicated in regulation of membrane protease activity